MSCLTKLSLIACYVVWHGNRVTQLRTALAASQVCQNAAAVAQRTWDQLIHCLPPRVTQQCLFTTHVCRAIAHIIVVVFGCFFFSFLRSSQQQLIRQGIQFEVAQRN